MPSIRKWRSGWARCLALGLMGVACGGAAQPQSGSAATPSDASARAESEKERAARRFFESYVALSDRFDPAVVELYADSARIRTLRASATGEKQELELPGERFKQLLVSALPIAQKQGDKNVFSKVSVREEPRGVRVTAERYSTLKCTLDKGYFMIVAADAGGALRIVEEYAETTAASSCGVGEGNALDQRLRKIVEQLGPQLPLQLDAETKLEAVSEDGKRLTYRFTLLADGVDLTKLRAALESLVNQQTCVDPALVAIINEQGSVAYDYADAEGKPIASIIVDNCAKP